MSDVVLNMGERIMELALKISEELPNIDLCSSWHNFSFDFHFKEGGELVVKDIRLVKSD